MTHPVLPLAAVLAAALAAPAAGQDLQPAATRLECPSRSIYCPSGAPDRVILTPGANPAREMAVSWRTDARLASAEAEIRTALSGPNLDEETDVSGRTVPLTTSNGLAHHHQVRFTDLKPQTQYVYRVRGGEGWSEWFQFTTPSETFSPFRFLYFGDVQNDILELGSRVIRQAFRSTASPDLVVHAGDLVQLRDSDPYDDEWGQWFAAGGYNYAVAPQILAAGNHEYIEGEEDTDDALSPHWPLQFAFPGNGAPGLEATTQVVDYQGVRFIVLDGTSALNDDTLAVQTNWLRQVLADNTAVWTVVLMHQPLFTCARANDPARLKTAWRSLFQAGGVDLVLQGHDHCYSRLTDPEAGRAGFSDEQVLDEPVYVVSVAGGKMYALNDRARTQPDRTAEDTQLYQVVEVEADRLIYRAHTATGDIYDAFDLVQTATGERRIEATSQTLGTERLCSGETGPDGLPCTSRRR